MARVLYISYTGLLQPLGQSQVLQYLQGLSARHQITLLTYERKKDLEDNANLSKVQVSVNSSDIHWIRLRYHKSPTAIATTYDILAGVLVACFLALRYNIEIVHTRSYIPSIPALALKKLFGKGFIFDMRGFWADERVDGGIWSRESRKFRVAKWFERKFLLNADSVVSLTRAGVRAIKKFDYLQGRHLDFEVIPTCTNLELFRPFSVENGEHGDKPFTLGYIGSVGTWYLFDEIADCFRVLLGSRPDAQLLVLNGPDHDFIRQTLLNAGVPVQNFRIIAVPYSDVPQQVARMDAGIFFIKPVFSKQASAPTKLGEFLACGKPCLANSGVGDVEEILDSSGVGVCIDEFHSAAYAAGLQRLFALSRDSSVTARCVDTAEHYFSLASGVEKYHSIYQRLAR